MKPKSFVITKNERVITSREEESINKYFRDISKIKLLSPEEEILLSKKIKEGDKVALDKLIVSNLRFVVSIAKQYQHKGVLLMDLINEGNIGLIHAAKTFDETKGCRFISYAVFWIRQRILQTLTEQSHLVHIPFNQYYLTSKVKKLNDEAILHNKVLSEEEIASNLDVTLEDVKSALNQNIGFAISLDKSVSSDDEEKSSLIDLIQNENVESPDSVLLKNSRTLDIMNFLSKVLDNKELEVIILNFGFNREFPMSFVEISDKLNLTKECIKQIKEKALRKLRLHDGNIILKQYL